MKAKTQRVQQNELDICVKIFEILGLQYFSVKNLTQENCSRRSIVRMIQLVTILTLLTSCFYIAVETESVKTNQKTKAKSKIMFAILNAKNFGILCIVWINVTNSYWNSFKIKKIFLNILNISKLCVQEFDLVIDFALLKKLVLRRTFAIILFTVIMNGCYAYATFEKFYDVIVAIAETILFLFISLAAYNFVFYVETINNQLLLVENLLNALTSQPKIIIENFHPNFTIVRPLKINNLTRQLIGIRKLYNLIDENAKIISEIFGIANLMMLATSVFGLTFSGYVMFVVILGDLEMKYLAGN